jgi:uncharacterized protein with ParB-like and HNH nuclease domain
LTYRNRKISFEKKNLLAYIHMLADGEFLIPTFQRNFIWNPEHISGLWESIFLGYPVGSIVYWRTPSRLKIPRWLGGLQIPQGGSSRGLHSYILDGQQRATSLFTAFYGGKGQEKGKRNFDFTLYFDLTKRNFFFEHELYRRRWNAPDEFLIRLRDVPDLPANYNKQLVEIKGYNRKIASSLKQLQLIFTKYEIPLIRLEGFDIADVCDVFERMNQTGVKLDNLDIIIARNFHDNPTIIEEDLPE